MFRVDYTVDSVEKIDKQLKYVNAMLKMKEDAAFQKYIQDKCMETLNNVMNSRLSSGMTTNDDSIELYRSSNHLQELKDGFIIYNNAKIPANAKGIQNSAENYPNGQFSIALAFEYGVGVVGVETRSQNSWEYNVKGYENGWYLPKDVFGESGIKYMGYTGFEVYRYTAEEIKAQLPRWVKEYLAKGVRLDERV